MAVAVATTAIWKGGKNRWLGRFEILEDVGVGGFGTVYKSRDSELGRLVAIKVPHAHRLASPADIDRFLREARTAARLKHPGIVQVYDTGHVDDTYFLVSEFVEGVTLADQLSGGRPPFTEAARLTAAVADTLQHAHQQGVIHRDVKPANIMIDAAGEPHLMDFGLAKPDVDDITVTSTGQMLGTPAYMSPEQGSGEGTPVDARTDLYSLGVVLYELLTGELPFRGNVRMLLKQVLQDEPRPPRRINDRIPRDLEVICLKAMAKEPRRRYASAAELAADLRRFIAGEPILAHPVSQLERWVRWGRRNPAMAGLLGTAAALLVIAGVAITIAYIQTRSALQQEVAHVEEIRNERDRANHFLYLSSMRLGQHAHASGNLAQLKEILQRQVPTRERRDYRHWEWYFLRAETGRIVKALRGADLLADGAEEVAWHPTGKQLVTVSGDDRIKFWEPDKARELATVIGPDKTQYSVVWSPDGRYVATGSEEGTARLWDVDKKRIIHTFRHPDTLVRGVAFNSDGRFLTTSGFDFKVRIWDTDTGDLTNELVYTSGINGVCWSPDDRFLAAGAEDYGVLVWQIDLQKGARPFPNKTGVKPRVLMGHNSYVQSVAWSPDSSRLASGSWDQTVRVWTVDGRQADKEVTLRGHTDRVHSVAWAPAERLASGSYDGSIRIWDLTSGEPTLTLRGDTGHVHGVAWSPDGQWLAVAGLEAAHIWDASARQNAIILRGHQTWAHSVAWKNNSNGLVSVGQDGAVRLWTLEPDLRSQVLAQYDAPIWTVSWSPVQNLLALAGEDGAVRVLRADTGEQLYAWHFQPAKEPAACWNPSGSHLCIVVGGGELVILDVATRTATRTLSGHTDEVYSVAWSPDGRRIVSGSGDLSARIWDVAAGKIAVNLKGHADLVYCVAWSPSDNQVATASYDGTVKVWDGATGKVLVTLRGHTARVRAVAWSPDGERLATGAWDQTVKIWDTVAWQEVYVLGDDPLPGSYRNINALAWSPDGRKLAAANEDGTVIVWDATPGYRDADALK